MSRKNLFGICYVSVWVVIWGTIGSLIDFPLLKTDLYVPGSFGQFTTFILSAVLLGFIAVWLYPKILESTIAVSAFGLDLDQKD